MIDSKINRDLTTLENGLSNLFLKNGWQVTAPAPLDFECLDLRGKVWSDFGKKKAELIVHPNFHPVVDYRMFQKGLRREVENYFYGHVDEIIGNVGVNAELSRFGSEYQGQDGLGKFRYQVRRFYEDHEIELVEKVVKLESNCRAMQAVFLERLKEYSSEQKSDLPKLFDMFVRDWDKHVPADDIKMGLEERRRVREIRRRNRLIGFMRWRVDTQFAENFNKVETDDLLRGLRWETGQVRNSVWREQWNQRINNLMFEISVLCFEIAQDRQLMRGDYLIQDNKKLDLVVDELFVRKNENHQADLLCRRWSEMYMKIKLGGLANINRQRLTKILGQETHNLDEKQVLEIIVERINQVSQRVFRNYDWERGLLSGENDQLSVLGLERAVDELRTEVQNKLRLSCDVRQVIGKMRPDNLYRMEMERLWSDPEVKDIDAHVMRDKVRDEFHRVYFKNIQALIQDCRLEYVDRVFSDEEQFNLWRINMLRANYENRQLRNRLINGFNQLVLRTCVDLTNREIDMKKRVFLRNILNRYEEYKGIAEIFTIV